MKKQFYVNKKSQLRSLVKRLNLLLKQQNNLKENQLENLVLKIKELIKELLHLFSRRELKRVLGAAAILIGMSFTNPVKAQVFANPVENPFGLVNILGVSAPTFADLDGDGDIDLLAGDDNGRLQYFENIGTETAPQFGPPQESAFGLSISLFKVFPVFVDLDADGDYDIISGNITYGSFRYYQNTGTITEPHFTTPQFNPFGLVNLLDYAHPSVADIDNDGDFDLIVGDYNGLQFFENIGTINDPLFATVQPFAFGIISTGLYLASPTFTDLDNDGDFDLLIGDYFAALQYYENLGTPTNPQFASAQENPFGLSSTNNFAYPAFADLDNDGDMDLLVGEFPGSMQYFENTITVGIAEIERLNLDLYPNPVRNILNLEVEEQIDRIEIMDVTGKQIITLKNPGKQISFSDLQPGMYMLKITSVDGNYTVKKIQKQ